jgi:Flp pilus assembly pilin Flp
MMERLMLWGTALFGRAQELREEPGQAVVEYGVLLALILVLAIVFIGHVGTVVSNAFSDVYAAL